MGGGGVHAIIGLSRNDTALSPAQRRRLGGELSPLPKCGDDNGGPRGGSMSHASPGERPLLSFLALNGHLLSPKGHFPTLKCVSAIFSLGPLAPKPLLIPLEQILDLPLGDEMHKCLFNTAVTRLCDPCSSLFYGCRYRRHRGCRRCSCTPTES